MGFFDGVMIGAGLVCGVRFGLWILEECFGFDLIAKFRGSKSD